MVTDDDDDVDDEHDDYDHDHDDDYSVQILTEKSAKANTWKTRYESKRRCAKYGDRYLYNTCKLSHHPE
jgi:hypothetical protein